MRFRMPLLIALSLFPSRRLQNENGHCCATKVPDVKLHPILSCRVHRRTESLWCENLLFLCVYAKLFIGALNRSGARFQTAPTG